MKQRPCILVLLLVLGVKGWFTDELKWWSNSKKDKDTSHMETPINFNCAAKYVDFNGGWVVDVVSFH